ncbi:MAG: TonB-dependent receptor [Opitutales bacterium]|nr:TonB-dependent receptor [Opitutales bacterium]
MCLLPAYDDSDLLSLDIEALMKVDVFTVSRRDEKMIEAGSSISVITERNIRELGLTTLRDVMTLVPGFMVIPDRDEWIFAARGNTSDNNQKYLILIDGHPMNSSENFGAGNLIELPNDLSNVKQVEVIRGPGSVVWGASALAGVINVITKNPGDLNRSVYGSVSYGSNDTTVINFQAKHQFENELELLFMGTYASSDGEPIRQSQITGLPILESDVNADITLPTVSVVDDRRTSNSSDDVVLTEQRYPGNYETRLDRLKPSYRFQLKGTYRNWSLNAYYYDSSIYNRHFEYGQGREVYLDNTKYFVESAYSKAFMNGIDLEWRMSYTNMMSAYQPTERLGLTEDDFRYAKFGNTFFIDWNSNNFNQSIRFNIPLEEKGFLAFGVSFDRTEHGPNHRIDNYDPHSPNPDEAAFQFDDHNTEQTVGAYGLLDYQLSDEVKITVGSWLDYNTDRGSDIWNFSPRAGVIWNPIPQHAIKLLYNRSFLRPTNFQVSSNPDVSSEIMNQVDFIYMHQTEKFQVALNLFWQRLDDYINIVQTADFSGHVSAGSYESRGVELELFRDVTGNLSIWGNVSYADAEAYDFTAGLKEDEKRVDPNGKLLNYPEWNGSFGGTVRFLEKQFFVSPSFRFIGETSYRKSWVGAVNNVYRTIDYPTEYGNAGPFYYLDVVLGYEPSNQIGFYLKARNLNNERSPMFISIWNGTVEQEGTYVELKTRFSF